MDDRNIIAIEECGYRVTWNLTPRQVQEIGQIREEVFCRELGWVISNGSHEEWDEFDLGSKHIAVLDRVGAIVGAVRVTMFDKPWMIDTVFGSLVPGKGLEKKRACAEASRLLVVKQSRNRRLSTGRHICDLLYKAAYGYCQSESIRSLYMVVSNTVFRHLVRRATVSRPCSS